MPSYTAMYHNIFVMRTDLFDDYAKWSFSIPSFKIPLESQNGGMENSRLLTFVGERLTAFYFYYLASRKDLKVQKLPVTFLRDTTVVEEIQSAFAKNNIPVCFTFSYVDIHYWY